MNTLVTILLVCAALIVVVAGLHLFVTGLLVRNQAVRPPLGLFLRDIPVGSHAWNAGHQAVWVLLFMGGVLGTAQGIAVIAMAFMHSSGSTSTSLIFLVMGALTVGVLGWNVQPRLRLRQSKKTSPPLTRPSGSFPAAPRCAPPLDPTRPSLVRKRRFPQNTHEVGKCHAL